MPHNFKTTFEKILSLFQELNITYVLIGAWASSFWGQARGTEDLDFLVLVNKQEFGRLKKKINSSTIFKLDKVWEKENPTIRDTHIRILCNNIHLDIIIPSDMHDNELLKRRILKKIYNLQMYIASPEDVIIGKIKIGRPKDFQDALSVFVKNKAILDHNYIDLWAKKLSIFEELNWSYSQV